MFIRTDSIFQLFFTSRMTKICRWSSYITYIKEQAGEEPDEIWNVNIFGKTLEQLVDDGISGKVTKINDDSQEKLQNAMEKIVNESSGGLICIII